MKRKKILKSYRLAIPISLCVSIEASTTREARAKLTKILKGSPLECGIDLDSYQLDPFAYDLGARLYANAPFSKQISVEDICPLDVRVL
jgi:hypothetical protein